MKKTILILLSGGTLVVGMVTTSLGFADSEHNREIKGTLAIEKLQESDFPALATIPLEQAIQRALNAIDGQVLKMELENENGYLVYGFEIVGQHKNISKVKIDAGSGQVLLVKHDQKDKNDDEESDEDNDN